MILPESPEGYPLQTLEVATTKKLPTSDRPPSRINRTSANRLRAVERLDSTGSYVGWVFGERLRHAMHLTLLL